MGKLGAYCLVVARDPSELKQVGRMARIVHTRRRSSVSAARRRGSRRAGRRGRDARQRGGSRFPRGCALLAPKLATRGAWLALATNARIARVIGFMASRRAEESSWLRTFLFQPLVRPRRALKLARGVARAATCAVCITPGSTMEKLGGAPSSPHSVGRPWESASRIPRQTIR